MRERRVRTLAEPMLTPLCDAAMTLIVVFIMTLPAVIWSGFDVDSTQTTKDKKQAKTTQSKYIAVSISQKGVFFNGKKTDPKKLYTQIQEALPDIDDNSVIVIPDDDVMLDTIVQVFDIAKLAGAERFALLKPVQ